MTGSKLFHYSEIKHYNWQKRRNIITFLTKNTGQQGEDIAAKYLTEKGYKIISRNVRFSKECEIDIIAKDKNETVFVEVKTRKSLNTGHPFEAINRRKIEKIYLGILKYTNEKKIKDWRIDAVAVIGTVSPKIEHLKNIGLDWENIKN